MEEDIGAYYKKRAVILRITDNGVRKNSSDLGQLQSAVVYVGSTCPRDADDEVYASNRKVESSTIANNGNRKAVLKMAH